MNSLNNIFCSNCGNAITSGDRFCKSCGAVNPNYNSVNTNPQQNLNDAKTETITSSQNYNYFAENNNPAPQPVANSQHTNGTTYNGYAPVTPTYNTPVQNNFQPPEPPKKKNNKGLIIALIIIALVVVAAGVFLALTLTHVICLNHDWQEAGCTTPQTCSYCGKTKGEIEGHKWQDATCTTPKTCSVCKKKNGEPAGHTDSEWIITTESTLMETGKEKLVCANCDEELDVRDVDKKKAGVEGKSFNFKDDEFIAWLEENTTLIVSNLVELDSGISVYNLYLPSGEAGLIMLSHVNDDENENIDIILVYFEDTSSSIAAVSVIGANIGDTFDDYSAAYNIVYGHNYTKDSMTAMTVQEDAYTYAVLCPSSIFSDIQTT